MSTSQATATAISRLVDALNMDIPHLTMPGHSPVLYLLDDVLDHIRPVESRLASGQAVAVDDLAELATLTAAAASWSQRRIDAAARVGNWPGMEAWTAVTARLDGYATRTRLAVERLGKTGAGVI